MEVQNKYSLGPGFESSEWKEKKGIPLPILLFLLASLMLAGISMYRFPESLSEYKVFREAKERIENGETSLALQELYEVQELHPNALPVTLELIELSMETGYYDLAAYVFNEYLVGKDLSDGQYARMMRYSRRLESYFTTYDSIDALMAELDVRSEADDSEEAVPADTERIREELTRLHGDADQDAAFLYYYQAVTSQERTEYYDYLQKAYAEDPELFDVRVLLANAERSRGNFEKSRSLLEQAIAKEGTDAGALRGLSVLAMLEGDFEEGLARAGQAYASDPDSMYVRDTYLIALHVNGDTAEAEKMAEEIRRVEGSLDEDTQQLLNGTISLEDYYLDKNQEAEQ